KRNSSSWSGHGCDGLASSLNWRASSKRSRAAFVGLRQAQNPSPRQHNWRKTPHDKVLRALVGERVCWRTGYGDMSMRILVLAALLGLAACGTSGMSGAPGTPGYPGQQPSPVPLPANGPIVYTCSDGTQLTVDIEGTQARVAIIGGPSMVLPNSGPGAYS